MVSSYLKNSLSGHGRPLLPPDAIMLGAEGTVRVRSILAQRQGHAVTPLHALPGLADALGLGTLFVKDEGFRLGLGSFKALGGAYALMVLVQNEASRQLGRDVPDQEIFSTEVRKVASTMTFACATDGNHGRSVAQGAQQMGASSVVFVHAGVSPERIEAIAKFGARIVRVEGGYDDSVQEATRVASEEGWTILSDTSWPGYEHIPGLVSQGYTAMVTEVLERLASPPTHVFLQAGVGGFAAAIAGHLSMILGNAKPHVTIVEPERAACVYESARVGHATSVDDNRSTVMAMLECHTASPLAFRVLERAADGFMTIGEDAAIEAMQRLATPLPGDPPVVAGESGGAGLAGLIAAVRDRELADSIGLDARSSVLVINTEGATDATLYHKLVGRHPHEVLSGKKA